MLAKIAIGDEQAFAQIFEQYNPIIYTYVLRISGSETLTQEIVQDAFLKTWLKRDKLPEIENFGGWLFRIAANLTYDALRNNIRDARKFEELKKISPAMKLLKPLLLQKLSCSNNNMPNFCKTQLKPCQVANWKHSN